MKTFHVTYRFWNGKLGVEEFKTYIFKSSDYEIALKECVQDYGHLLVKLIQL